MDKQNENKEIEKIKLLAMQEYITDKVAEEMINSILLVNKSDAKDCEENKDS